MRATRILSTLVIYHVEPPAACQGNLLAYVRSKVNRPAARLAPRTRKSIDTLPVHARHIYIKAHKNALKQYKSPAKRRRGKSQSREQVAHKVAWSAVKKAGYRKEGDRWEKV